MADEKKKQELIVNQLAGKHRFKGADEHQEYVKFIDRALSLKKQMDDAIEAKDYKLCDQLDQQAIVKDFPMTFDDFERFKVSPQR
jgi:HPt (histidine-containing phosphotransfer) domain-containing protein